LLSYGKLPAPGSRFVRSTRRFTPAAIGVVLVWTAVGAASILLFADAAQAGISFPNGGAEYRGHVFPVQGPHWTRGAIGEFGAPRSGGRTHEGFDVVAPCGSRLVAVRNGRVRRRGYDPVLYGNYLLIHGEGEHRSYFYAHLRRPAGVHRGQRLFAGRRVGVVGRTGNARTVGCHLHFEIHVDGRPIDPAPFLRRWDRYS
jgi:murein DD-endopeptidase MepM/ murein hydrolase activator NlpD